MSRKTVLSLGQCGADHAVLSRWLGIHFGADVTAARTFEEALAQLRQGEFALVLVNRILDYDGRRGVEFISRLKEDTQLTAVHVMLISNYAEAQEEAVRRGAEAGFGKADLSEPETLDRLRPFLG
jgi:two-component system chemotaxis response regulator CheY